MNIKLLSNREGKNVRAYQKRDKEDELGPLKAIRYSYEAYPVFHLVCSSETVHPENIAYRQFFKDK